MQKKAFTLVELLIVLSIIAILISIAVPGWATITRRFQVLSILDANAMTIAMALSEARAWSMNRQDSTGNVHPVRIRFVVEEDTLFIKYEQQGFGDDKNGKKELVSQIQPVFVGASNKEFYYVFGLWASQTSPSSPFQVEDNTTINLTFGEETKLIQIVKGLPKVIE